MLKGYQILLEATRTTNLKQPLLPILKRQREKLEKPGVNKFGNYWDVWEEIIDHDFDVHRMLSGGMMSLSVAFDKVMRVETAKQVTITAIALKRYQLKHGNCPPDLNLLVPEFIPAVPIDPVDGQPLRYRRNADDSFLLYSVGENGVDDGGDPSLETGVTGSNFYWQNPHALDWVWPQPATAAEIQKYYEEQAKKSKECSTRKFYS